MTHIVCTADLAIAYEAWGAPENPPVILLHGFPDDATAWNGVARAIASRYWVLAPYARGVGSTRFLRADTPRSGQLAARAADILAFANALGLNRFALVGQDWGQRSAQAVAALYPDRVSYLVSIGDYALAFDRSNQPSVKQLFAFRFHFLMNTPFAEPVLKYCRRPLFRHLWRSWSPHQAFDAAAFEAVAPSFDNPDFVALVVSTYRQFSGKGTTDPTHAGDEERLAEGPTISVPTTIVRATEDGLDLFDPSRSLPSGRFTGAVRLRLIEAGHVPQREQPEQLALIVLESL